MKKRILIVAGGTGGHILPALAVAKTLEKQGAEIHWLGSGGHLEQQIVVPEFPFTAIAIKGLRKSGWLRLLSSPWKITRAIFASWRLIRRFSPDVVLAMGGFVSGPAGVAAWLARKPLIIHEQNAKAGLTNRYLAKFATSVLEAFPKSFPANVKTSVVGNPVREELLELTPPQQRFADREGALHLLILGGSQGANYLNEQLINVLTNWPEKTYPRVWHQTGKKHYEQVCARYQALGIDARVDAYITDMAQAYAWADLIFARSGAMTVAELAVVGLASVLVPYPFAVDDHQWLNAHQLEKVGAARVIRQEQLSVEHLEATLLALNSREQLLEMAQAAQRIAQPQATLQVIAECDKLVPDS